MSILAKTFLQTLDELESLYKELISLLPYQNDPDSNRRIKEIRAKTHIIESTFLDY